MKKRNVAAVLVAVLTLSTLVLAPLHWSLPVAQAANTNSLSLARSSSQSATSTDTGFPTGNNAWTVEAWVKLQTNNQWGDAVGWGTETSDSKASVDVYCGNDAGSPGKMYVYTRGGGTVDYSNTAIPTGEWHHCAVTWDGTNIRYYLDGQPDGTATFTNIPSLNVTLTGAAHLGAMHYPGGVDSYFDGFLDEVRAWNVARSQQQIQANMNSEIEPSASLVAYWRLNNIYGDESGNGNTLHPVNSPSFSTDIFQELRLAARKTGQRDYYLKHNVAGRRRAFTRSRVINIGRVHC